MLSGASLSHPISEWTRLPVSPFCWNPVESSRRWWSSIMMWARLQISLRSRKEDACAVTDPLFMPDQMQSGPPAAWVVRLFSSQISVRRS